MIRFIICVSLAALSCASAARADWQYTRWGMTPEQVVAASRGQVKLRPEKDWPRGADILTAATGEYEDGSMQFRSTFMFDTATKGLKCVAYGLTAPENDERFKAALVKQYGPVESTSGIAILDMTNLSWVTATDTIEATFSKSDPAYVMHCKK
jgi:hypothetical protein